MTELVYTPSEFVAIANQILEHAFAGVVIEGELSEFRVSKNRWVYFNLKDEGASVKFFGVVSQLPGPLEEGMRVRVVGQPTLHPVYGFSITMRSLTPSGEGSIKKAFDLLVAKLQSEGLFEVARKRHLPYPPRRVGLITSLQSAAYVDFIKVLQQRWGGLQIVTHDTQVQGEPAATQIVAAIEAFNRQADLVDVLVITRGGGSKDDLSVFNLEPVVRAVGASRIPTLVAIGHEVDESLAERAADVRASTPSNAAECLVPDRRAERSLVESYATRLTPLLTQIIKQERERIAYAGQALNHRCRSLIEGETRAIHSYVALVESLNPRAVLKRGYAIIRSAADANRVISRSKDIPVDEAIIIEFADGRRNARLTS